MSNADSRMFEALLKVQLDTERMLANLRRDTELRERVKLLAPAGRDGDAGE